MNRRSFIAGSIAVVVAGPKAIGQMLERAHRRVRTSFVASNSAGSMQKAYRKLQGDLRRTFHSKMFDEDEFEDVT